MKTSSIALRALVIAGVVSAFLVGAAVAPGDPGTGDGSLMFRDGPAPVIDVGAQVCGFPFRITYLRDMSKVISDTTAPDGTETVKVEGEDVVSFTNPSTGKTIVENDTASSLLTFHPDGTGTQEVHGRNFFTFGPRSRANTGEPFGLFLTNGHATVSFAFGGNLATSFTFNGRQENLCDQLS
jgi:hypothetical protein